MQKKARKKSFCLQEQKALDFYNNAGYNCTNKTAFEDFISKGNMETVFLLKKTISKGMKEGDWMNYQYLFYMLLGYLSGSILFGSEIPRIMKGVDVREESEDGNPGTFNAFVCGGVGCGILCLLAELGKGILPVALCSRRLGTGSLWFALVLAAPVVGHAFSLYHHGNGGKAIAVSFGVLLGLVPYWRPVLILAAYYLLFSVVVPVKSHGKRSAAAFAGFAGTCFLLLKERSIVLGSMLIASVVIYKHYTAAAGAVHNEERWGLE